MAQPISESPRQFFGDSIGLLQKWFKNFVSWGGSDVQYHLNQERDNSVSFNDKRGFSIVNS